MYEIYWWFAAGLTLALERILRTASEKTSWLETTASSAPLRLASIGENHSRLTSQPRMQEKIQPSAAINRYF
jgi:hypothetical protein